MPVLILVTMAMFGLLQLTPGGPIEAMFPPQTPIAPSVRAALERELGLNQPLPIRYIDWLWQVLHGNLGFNLDTGQPVSQAIAEAIGPTMELMGAGLLVGIVVGILLGILSAVYQYSVFDLVMTALAFLGIAMPAFVAGLLGLYLFSLKLGWFPSGGITTPGEPATVGDNLFHLILPASLLSVSHVAGVMRYTRAAVLEVLREDYIRTARAKGSAPFRVMWHAFRNAMLPVITVIGASIPSLIAGAVYLETIFSWPGMGLLFENAVTNRNYSLILGMTLILAIVVFLANLATDIAYAFADPRIRYGT